MYACAFALHIYAHTYVHASACPFMCTRMCAPVQQGVAGRRREWWLDVERVSQLDALRLDGEMRALLREQLRRMLALVPVREGEGRLGGRGVEGMGQ